MTIGTLEASGLEQLGQMARVVTGHPEGRRRSGGHASVVVALVAPDRATSQAVRYDAMETVRSCQTWPSIPSFGDGARGRFSAGVSTPTEKGTSFLRTFGGSTRPLPAALPD